jgi:TolB-like protein
MSQFSFLRVLPALLLSPAIAFAQVVVDRPDAHVLARSGHLISQGHAYEPIVVQSSSSSAGIFNSGMIFLADQLDRNVDPAFRSRPTVITSIASLANLNESSGLGRLVGEHLIHELQVRAWSVADVRLTRGLIVNNGGEFSLSRDMTQLRESFPIANIVTGTYSTTPDGVLLSVRVIDSSTGRVVSSAQTRFLRDRFIASLVDRPVEVPTIRLTASCPSGLVCGAGK